MDIYNYKKPQKETGNSLIKQDNFITWSEVISNHLIEVAKKHEKIFVYKIV